MIKTFVLPIMVAVITGTTTWIMTSNSRLSVLEAEVKNIEEDIREIKMHTTKLYDALSNDG